MLQRSTVKRASDKTTDKAKTNNTATLRGRVSQELKTAVNIYASARETTEGQVVRLAVTRLLEKEKKAI